tara:strand:- start:91 stop:1215 length:1125 start_codon:yes stop_codon:yes gene_type:complete
MINGIYDAAPRYLHLEPTSDCNARCPQCPRTLTSTLETHPNLEIKEWTPRQIKGILKNEYFKTLEHVLINGNFGDIVMHSNPKALIATILKFKVKVEIRTNGGALGVEFWKWLGSFKNVEVEFGIDGLADTHHLYRRNTRFDTVIKNAKSFIDAGGNASWAMTVFKHNDHQVGKCKALSLEYGFKKFKERPSVRWNENRDYIIVDKSKQESYRLEPSSAIADRFSHLPKQSYEAESYDASSVSKSEVSLLSDDGIVTAPNEVICKVKKSSSVYLSADGRLWPCCWVAFDAQNSLLNMVPGSFSSRFYKQKNYPLDFNNIIKNDIKDVIASGLFLEIEKAWLSKNPFNSCASQCTTHTEWNTQLANTKVLRNNNQ